jgi:hypothetical protein
MIKPREIRRAGLAAGIEKTRNSLNLKGRKHLEDQHVDGRITLKLIFKTQGGRVLAGFIWLTIETNFATCN